tara:strand:- start:645866 stop:646837 length:972 start_codon:yes stop_codon:yes gene_type:complete
MMRIGFHASSLLLHDEVAIVSALAAIGYQAVTIRPRCGSLDPTDERFAPQMLRLADAIARNEMQLIIDTNGAFLSDPHRYDGPALAADDGAESDQAEAWILRWIEIAEEFSASTVIFSTGSATRKADTSARRTPAVQPGTAESNAAQLRPEPTRQPLPFQQPAIAHSGGGNAADESTLNRLSERLNRLTERSKASGVRLALRPASRDVVATVAQFERIVQWVDQPDTLYLAADVAEMLKEGEFPVADRLTRNLSRLACVYLCEREADGSRDQLPTHCEIDMGRITQSLRRLGFAGTVIAKVQGHSEKGLGLARDALEWFAETD